MTDLVRARIGNAEKSVSAGFARRHELEVLDEPALTQDGRVRPTTRIGGRSKKRKTSVAQAAAEKQAAAQDASTPEEAHQ